MESAFIPMDFISMQHCDEKASRHITMITVLMESGLPSACTKQMKPFTMPYIPC